MKNSKKQYNIDFFSHSRKQTTDKQILSLETKLTTAESRLALSQQEVTELKATLVEQQSNAITKESGCGPCYQLYPR